MKISSAVPILDADAETGRHVEVNRHTFVTVRLLGKRSDDAASSEPQATQQLLAIPEIQFET
jgi:hypothetical protein